MFLLGKKLNVGTVHIPETEWGKRRESSLLQTIHRPPPPHPLINLQLQAFPSTPDASSIYAVSSHLVTWLFRLQVSGTDAPT